MKAFALLFALAISVALVGCNKLEVAGSGETIKPTRDDRTFTMTVETIPAEQITQHCAKLGVSYDANGCSAFNLDTKHCTIYVVPPRGLDDTDRFSVVGHETWHCRFGEWHQ